MVSGDLRRMKAVEMELSHTCGPAKSLDNRYMPAIEDTFYYNPDKKVWYAGHEEEAEVTVVVKFCPFCGVEFLTPGNLDAPGC